jgi:beta-lactam-binding protein with PASTA domain
MLRFAPMVRRLLTAFVFLLCGGIVFWFALVHTVHRGTLAVPELREDSLEEARRQVHDLGLELTVEEPGLFSTAVPPGLVASQEPPPGFHVKAGSAITIRLSLGGETVSVPEVRGSSLKTAQREVEKAGLTPGQHARVEGHGAGDQVIATGPPVGQEVAPMAPVDLLVNTVPRRQLWVMPSLVSQRMERVEHFCRVNRLRLGQAREVEYPGIPPGVVLRQYPAAGSPVAPSEIITVWVSQ